MGHILFSNSLWEIYIFCLQKKFICWSDLLILCINNQWGWFQNFLEIIWFQQSYISHLSIEHFFRNYKNYSEGHGLNFYSFWYAELLQPLHVFTRKPLKCLQTINADYKDTYFSYQCYRLLKILNHLCWPDDVKQNEWAMTHQETSEHSSSSLKFLWFDLIWTYYQ